MWGMPQNVIEERVIHVDDIPQGSAMEVLREAIQHGGVQSQLPVGMERKNFGSSNRMNPFLIHMVEPGKDGCLPISFDDC